MCFGWHIKGFLSQNNENIRNIYNPVKQCIRRKPELVIEEKEKALTNETAGVLHSDCIPKALEKQYEISQHLDIKYLT